MKVCVPTNGNRGIDEEVGQHFGMAPTYTVVDTNTNEVTIIDNTSNHMGGSGHPPELIKNAGADIVLVGGLGGRAIMMFNELGIKVYIGAKGTVKDTIQLWKDEKLEEVSDPNQSTCNHHACGDEGSEHHH